MKKILIIIGALRTGGAEKITVDLVKNMDRTGLKFYFLVFGNDIGNYEDNVKKMGGEVIHVACPSFPYFKYKYDIKNVWEQQGPFDVIHTHTLLNNGINCKIACGLGCKRIISHSHSSNSNRKDNFVTKIYEYVMKNMIKKYATDYLACGIEAGKYLYGENLFKNNGIVINNGVDFNTISFNIEARKQIRSQLNLENTYVIGHVARLAKVKNHEFVLSILKELKKDSANYRYIIVGDGPNRENIKKKVKELDLEKEVIMLGNRDDIFLLQNSFDLVLYPSFYEGLPVALIEAQVNGIPCIISENVSKEVKIREKTKFVSLEKSAKEWADEVRSYQEITREENLMLENGNLYNIKCSAEKLRQIYIRDGV